MKWTSADREAFLKALPFVQRLQNTRPCDGIKWSRVPVKAVWHPKTHRRQPESTLDPYRCKNRARWKFTALRRSDAESGVYCMSHLVTQMYADSREWRRTEKYTDRFAQSREGVA